MILYYTLYRYINIIPWLEFILFISVIPVTIVYNKVKAQKRQLVAQTLREKTSQTDIYIYIYILFVAYKYNIYCLCRQAWYFFFKVALRKIWIQNVFCCWIYLCISLSKRKLHKLSILASRRPYIWHDEKGDILQGQWWEWMITYV